MKNVLERSRLVLSLLCVAMLVLLAACGGGDDEEDTEVAVAPTTAELTGDATPTEEEEATMPIMEASPTAAASPTATERAPLPTTAASPVSTESITLTPSLDASPTTSADASPGTGVGEDPFADVETIDPEALPNFTLEFSLELAELGDQEDTTLELLIEQAALDNYHMLVRSDDTNIEVWQVGEAYYLSQDDGTVTEVPAGAEAGLFSPQLFLQSLPPLDPALNAEEVGEEEVNGRQTTHYRISGEDYLRVAALAPVEELSDIEGEVEVWVDNELNIMILQEGDITWMNADGSEGSFTSFYEIRDIGETTEVEAPQ